MGPGSGRPTHRRLLNAPTQVRWSTFTGVSDWQRAGRPGAVMVTVVGGVDPVVVGTADVGVGAERGAETAQPAPRAAVARTTPAARNAPRRQSRYKNMQHRPR